MRPVSFLILLLLSLVVLNGPVAAQTTVNGVIERITPEGIAFSSGEMYCRSPSATVVLMGDRKGKWTDLQAGDKVRLALNAQKRVLSVIVTGKQVPSGVSSVSPLFVGDFESGDLSQWGLVQVAATDRAEVVRWPVTQGSYALRLTTRYGDVPSGSGSGARNRAQVNGPTIHQEGEEDYTRVSLRVPTGFPMGTASDDFQLAWQWHGAPHIGSPPISIAMSKDRAQWEVRHNPFEPDGDVNSPQSYRITMRRPLTKDVWHHFIFRVKWSRYSAKGFFEVWHAEGSQKPVKLTVENGPSAGGQSVLGPTLNSRMTQGVRPIAANYRRQETTRQEGTIFYDGIAVGDSFQAVWP